MYCVGPFKDCSRMLPYGWLSILCLLSSLLLHAVSLHLLLNGLHEASSLTPTTIPTLTDWMEVFQNNKSCHKWCWHWGSLRPFQRICHTGLFLQYFRNPQREGAQKMGKTGSIGIFIFGTHDTSHRYSYYRSAVVFVQNNMQAVVECELLKLNFIHLSLEVNWHQTKP